MKESVTGSFQNALNLREKPEISWFKHRKLSLLYRIRCEPGDFFLKIPKESGKRCRRLSDIEPRSLYRAQAQAEWDSLCHLYRQSQDPECPVAFVKPVALIQDPPAVVTEAAPGRDFYKTLLLSRRKDAILGNREIFRTIGKAIRFFHDRNPGDGVERFSGIDPERIPGRPEWEGRLDDLCRRIAGRSCPLVVTMTGFSVTDILVDADGNLCFLDPGVMRPTTPYEQLADFILEIVKARRPAPWFWSSVAEDRYVESFLDGYTDRGGEFDHHWLAALLAEKLMRELSDVEQKLVSRATLRRGFGVWDRKRFKRRVFIDEIERTLAASKTH